VALLSSAAASKLLLGLFVEAAVARFADLLEQPDAFAWLLCLLVDPGGVVMSDGCEPGFFSVS